MSHILLAFHSVLPEFLIGFVAQDAEWESKVQSCDRTGNF